MKPPPEKKRRAPGAGRPPKVPGERLKPITVNISDAVLNWITDQKEDNRSAHICRILRAAMELSRKETKPTKKAKP